MWNRLKLMSREANENKYHEENEMKWLKANVWRKSMKANEETEKACENK
jgi:hypothetical protein